MGAGIGQLAAVRGYDVVMKEINPEAADAGRHRIEKLVDDLAKRKDWDSRQRDEVLERVTISCDDSSLAACDLVVEAVVEREDVKAQVFDTLDKVVQRSAILASNTSSLIGDENGGCDRAADTGCRTALLQSCASNGIGRSGSHIGRG